MMNTATITADEAAALWQAVRAGFTNVEHTLREIVRRRAWEAEGYATFADAWRDKMIGVRLAEHATQVNVVYQLLADGVPSGEVVSLSGVGDARVERVRKQRDAGVPPDAITLTAPVRPARRDARYLVVPLPISVFAQYERICRVEGRTMQDEGVEALQAWFDSKASGDEHQESA